MNLFILIPQLLIMNLTISTSKPKCENLHEEYQKLKSNYIEYIYTADGITSKQFIEWGEKFWLYVESCPNNAEVYKFSKKSLEIFSNLNNPNLIEQKLESLTVHNTAKLSVLEYWESILTIGKPTEENKYLKKLQSVAKETNNKSVQISAFISIANWYYENNFLDKSRDVLAYLTQNSDITYANPFLSEKINALYERIGILKVGNKIPVFNIELFNGNMFSSQDLSGNYTFLYFYGSTCGSCVSMYPKLNALEERYSDENFQIIGVGHDWQVAYGFNTEEEFNTFLKRFNIKWQQALKNNLWESLKINRLSTGLLIDPEGKLVRISNSDKASAFSNPKYDQSLSIILEDIYGY